jgi:hypothetical protein
MYSDRLKEQTMMKQVVLMFALLVATSGAAYAQQCLHGAGEAADETARRRQALTMARVVNTLQANRLDRATSPYLRHSDLAAAAQHARFPTLPQATLAPDKDVLPGWKLTVDVGENGYWFMIKDVTDPCGFAYISNQLGVIYTAEPIR